MHIPVKSRAPLRAHQGRCTKTLLESKLNHVSALHRPPQEKEAFLRGPIDTPTVHRHGNALPA